VSSPVGSRCALLLGFGALAALAAALGAASAHGSPIRAGAPELLDGPGAAFLAATALAFSLYALALASLRRWSRGLAAVAALAVAIQLAPLAGPLVLSRDAYSYWAYGRLVDDHAANPYRVAPARYADDPAVRATAAAWRDTRSVYGPVFTEASAGLAAVSGPSPETSSFVYRLLAACGMLGLAVVAALAAARRAFALALVGWNPLLALQFAGGGHNDVWLACFLAGAVALSARGRTVLSGTSWAVAAGLKWLPLVLLPLSLAARREHARRVAAGFAITTAAICASAFMLFGTAWLGALLPLAHRRSAYALPTRLAELGLPRWLALLPLVLGLPLLARGALHGRPRLALGSLLLLFASPWLLPWYGVWAISLAAVEEDTFACVLALGLSAYLLPDRIPL
jgi:glycosyl transferase family 87